MNGQAPITTRTIQQATQQPAAPAPKSPATIMRNILDAKATKDMLAGMLQKEAGAFTASVIDLYNTDEYLQKCQPSEVFAECLKAVSLNLPINKNLGFVWIVPRRSKGVWHPIFQIGVRGLIQLAQRSKEYKYINAGEVYEGEFLGMNKLTGEVDLSGEAKSDKVIGYFAYIETVYGFSKCLYWSKEKVIDHASKHSDSYKSGAAIWTAHFDEMAEKTVLSNLIKKYGPMSVSMGNAIASDDIGSAGKPDSPVSGENALVTLEGEVVDQESAEDAKNDSAASTGFSEPPVYVADGTEPF